VDLRRDAVATFAIAGIPPFAGFFSKDEILWQAFSSPHGHWLFWLVGIITAFMTSFYMFRLLFMTFYRRLSRRGCRLQHGHGDGHGMALRTRARGGVRGIYSGNIRSYAGWVSFGAGLVVFYMVWVATR
jgi:formate hydrogenlyase subunit 3/multisubunit Na+/H+ antiporter MnhD subunit